jgi:hypothetical protein
MSNSLAVLADYAGVLRGEGPTWAAPGDSNVDLLEGPFSRLGAGLTLTF